ncbi:acyl-CoA 6-desaturase isoform X2 [Dunckerocampus dactyliophorus]|nr:acyl-CoA 6-desaturase isoform X2 [Dunckerocampus dactyliophorus]XP_054631666.1 acyl-CoA 6-desaturase isoform X2 [Dunckerocampus dactyliophorus]
MRMGAGGQLTEMGNNVYTWEEIQRHCSRNDQWLVIDRKVYNITQWAKRHPGGFQVIHHYAGEDATDAFTAFHPDKKFVQRFLKPLLIGELVETEPSQDRQKNATVIKDFQALHAQAECQGLFQAQPIFFLAHLAHILLLEFLAWMLVWFWGTSWPLTLFCAVLLAIAQSQAGWLQHDFGHLSVFKRSTWNRVVHKFLIGHLKDMAWSVSYYLRYFSCYVPLYGLLGSIVLIIFVRFLESHWFVWVTQMNHLPMAIDHEKHQDWLTMQLQATCNIEKSFFNDWFSGHLNFQIEHHLFPTMPRHNFHRVAPLVHALCKKHKIPYQVKSLRQGLADVINHSEVDLLDHCPAAEHKLVSACGHKQTFSGHSPSGSFGRQQNSWFHLSQQVFQVLKQQNSPRPSHYYHHILLLV